LEARQLKTATVEALKSEIVRASSVINENRKLAEELQDESARLASDEKVLAALRRDVDLQMDVLRNAVQKTEKDLESNEEAKQRKDLFVERLTQEMEKIERKKAAGVEKYDEACGRIGELETEAKKVALDVEEVKKEVRSAEAGWRKAVSVASSRQENYSKYVILPWTFFPQTTDASMRRCINSCQVEV
jgi:chromosome segregation ATPase